MGLDSSYNSIFKLNNTINRHAMVTIHRYVIDMATSLSQLYSCTALHFVVACTYYPITALEEH